MSAKVMTVLKSTSFFTPNANVIIALKMKHSKKQTKKKNCWTHLGAQLHQYMNPVINNATA